MKNVQLVDDTQMDFIYQIISIQQIFYNLIKKMENIQIV